MSCLICERIEMIKQSINPYFVSELETGYVVIGDHQYFKGYTLFLLKEHITELHFIPKEMRTKHLEELSIVYEAVFNAFMPDKMNAELLGNGDPHMHWHIYPRFKTDPLHKRPVWKLTKELMFSDECRPSPSELNNMIEKVKSELEKLI